MNKLVTFLFLFATLSLGAHNVNKFNLTWNTPSENASGSMPIGNGEVGANVWVEQNGDLVFYISRTDSWNETGELFKLGRVRISTTPSLTSAGDFVQTLDLGNGKIRIQGSGIDLDFFIDSDSDVIYVKGKSKSPVDVKVTAEVWRTETIVITHDMEGDQYRSVSGFAEGQAEFRTYPDRIFTEADAVTVCHHNCESSYEATLQLENLQPENRASHDPFLNRAFGYSISGKGMKKISDLELSAESTKKIEIAVNTLCGIFPGTDEWAAEMDRTAAGNVSAKAAGKRTAKYWKKFWNRSWIEVETPDKVTGERINSTYMLQRWVQACGGRGNYPIKFNGTIFTVEPVFTDDSMDFGPDYRRWGGDFWWQNTRLNYYPMLKSGDFEMMKPLFEHYFNNLDLMKANAKALCGAEGALSPETQTVFGTYCCADFRWDRQEEYGSLAGNPYIKYHWDSSVEMISLMLDYWDYTSDREFVKTRVVPYAREMLTFYNSFYGRDAAGRLEITPTQSIETYWYDVVNDTPTVAGMHDVLPRLLALPAELSSEADKALWEELSACIPDVPTSVIDGKEMFLPAEKFDPKRTNCENPELYTIFPFHLCNITTDNLQTGINSFFARNEKAGFGWSQDGQEAAILGLGDDAAEILIKQLDYSNPNFRFPAMWGPNYDWVPDQDHGASILMTLQDMVLQTYDGVDYKLPAFPADWGVKYKLHSFGGKVVKGSKAPRN